MMMVVVERRRRRPRRRPLTPYACACACACVVHVRGLAMLTEVSIITIEQYSTAQHSIVYIQDRRMRLMRLLWLLLLMSHLRIIASEEGSVNHPPSIHHPSSTTVQLEFVSA